MRVDERAQIKRGVVEGMGSEGDVDTHTHTFTLIHINMQFTLLNNLSVFHILPDINQRDDADDRTAA